MNKVEQSPNLQTNNLEQWTIDNLEKFLLSICIEYSKQKRPIDIDVLYYRARRELGVPRIQIQTAIDNMIASKKIVPGKVLLSDNLLENDTRKCIFNIISKFPAVLAQEIKDNLEIGTSILIWHLKCLLDFGLIRQIELGGYRLFTSLETSNNDAIAYHFMAKSTLLQLLMRTIDGIQISLSLLLKSVPMKRPTLLYHLNKFVQTGILEIVIDSEEKKYKMSNNFKQNVYAILEKYFP